MLSLYVFVRCSCTPELPISVHMEGLWHYMKKVYCAWKNSGLQVEDTAIWNSLIIIMWQCFYIGSSSLHTHPISAQCLCESNCLCWSSSKCIWVWTEIKWSKMKPVYNIAKHCYLRNLCLIIVDSCTTVKGAKYSGWRCCAPPQWK